MQRPEEQVQRAIVDYLRWTRPKSLLWYAVANQRGTRSEVENKILKALGVRAGVADLVLVLDGGQTIFVEVKAPGREGALSPAQRDFLEAVTRLHTPYHVVSSLDDFVAILAKHKLVEPLALQRPV